MKKALIFDLDNTIYPVSSIAATNLKELFKLIDENSLNLTYEDRERSKNDLTRQAFDWVADRYNYSDALRVKGTQHLKDLTCDLPMQPFEDYQEIRKIPIEKYLVTMGFSKLQWSKVNMLNIEGDFTGIHIVDKQVSNKTKKDVFLDIMNANGYLQEELLAIGDDPESEIKAATELGIDTFLFDPQNLHPSAAATYRSNSLKDLLSILS